MRLVRIALTSVNTTVGAVKTNTAKAIAFAKEAAADQATIAVFQEQLIAGYPPEDLIQWQQFVDSQRVQLLRFADATSDLRTVFALGVTVTHAGHRFNCAAVVHAGKILGFVPKEKLANYNVFYEGRTFARGGRGFFAEVDGVPLGDYVFDFDFGIVAFEVCEDIWSPDGPMRRRAYAGAELVVNISASPYRLGINETRHEMLATRSADSQVAIAYVNAVGANDSLVFDGGGFIFQNGRLITAAPRFVEGIWSETIDLDRTSRLRAENTTFRYDWEVEREHELLPRIIKVTGATPDRASLRLKPPAGRNYFIPSPGDIPAPRVAFCQEVLSALTLGLSDYYDKSGAFKKIGISLSGGRDSLLALLVAHRTGKTIEAFTMPSHVTSQETLRAAETICRELGVPLKTIPIGDAYDRELEKVKEMGEEPSRLTLQNIQTRVRAARMWNWANSSGALWIHTGNMSEKAVGYTTVGGDLEGGYSVLSNVPKTLVITLLDYLLAESGLEGIRMTLETTAGPELEPDQSGEKELMPYHVLDACFYLYAAEKYTPDEIITILRPTFTEYAPAEIEEWVRRFVKLFTESIYKWVQAPLAIHIGNLDLERERALQIPVIQKREWME